VASPNSNESHISGHAAMAAAPVISAPASEASGPASAIAQLEPADAHGEHRFVVADGQLGDGPAQREGGHEGFDGLIDPLRHPCLGAG